ncbi:uncharacterized protein LOC141811966 [Curcuma longa]|uniref:uncharacterized protein LOC141811966 n=1 Tax=Curcuma longa TaxID=136217 RepID=UPI003D9EDB53
MAPPSKCPPSKAACAYDAGGGNDYCPDRPPFPYSYHRVEVTLISAQDLYPAARSMRSYAVAYIRPDDRARTRVDATGRTEPSWNDKFIFRVEDDVLRSDTASITIDVYAARSGLLFGPDTHIGTARALLSTLRPSSATRYAALQVRRPTSLRPQGILNISVALIVSTDAPLAPHADHGAAPSAANPSVPKSKHKKNPTAAANREVDPDRAKVEKKLKMWRAELPPVSGEVVREERAGRMGKARREEKRRAGMGEVLGEESVSPLPRLGRRPSFGRLGCFGGESFESGELEFVAPPPPLRPRHVQERPHRRAQGTHRAARD